MKPSPFLLLFALAACAWSLSVVMPKRPARVGFSRNELQKDWRDWPSEK